MIKCLDCGYVFESPNECTANYIAYGDGMYAEKECCCPHCKSDNIEEAQQCKECGEWFTEDEISAGYCDKCYEKITKELSTPQQAYEIAQNNDMFKRIEINEFLAWAFTKDEIEEILLNELKKSNSNDYIQDFLFDCEDETVKYYEGVE